MVQAIDGKWKILREAEYTYDFRRMVYLNRRTKKVFSFEFVEDHSESEVQRCIDEPSNGAEWRFYFNSPPSASVQRELENVLG
ncbi:MAG TPA: hypothetical protein VEO19_14140 [Terriglobia bacterium]|jgi:hypothetical protein|nr:hypothetical protein [Terriglobia bacterium]